IIGMPHHFREDLQRGGFKIIADQKAFTTQEKQQLQQKMRALTKVSDSHEATPCVDNDAGGFPCTKIDLMRHLSLQALRSYRANDIWGFYDLNTQREYAIIGVYDGVVVVDVTLPQASEVVAKIAGPESSWRDIKIYQHFD